ncbi:MAG: SIMPL domain-containing protein [Patescibacteria group bacterium]
MCDRECLKNTLIAAFSIFTLLFLFFKFGPRIPLSIISQPKGEPLIVTGEGKVSVTPDIAKVTLGIQENGQVLKQVQNNVNKKSKTLTDSLKKLGIGEKDIKTVSYSVYPQYDYTQPNSKITGYQVSTSYEVTIKDFDKVNDVLVQATTAGANSAGAISFEVNDETKAKKLQEAREEAVHIAKVKAEGLAKAAGISLGKIINISESQGNEIRPMYATKDAVGLGGSTPVPANIQPGETEISVTVSLSYEIK